MKFRSLGGVGLLLTAYLAFLLGARNVLPPATQPLEIPGSVVLPAPLQAVIYLGDPYLAANVEAIRVLGTGGPVMGVAQDYYDRLHHVVTVLNPCHEDSYYIANSLLAWAGNVDGALAILNAATRCRFWDELPPFFLGYDLYFFKREHHAAREALFEAAARASDNRIVFEGIGIKFESEGYPDLHAAMEYLSAQRKQTRDEKLKMLIDIRIGRLNGLIALHGAQLEFERRFGHPLQNPEELQTRGVLNQWPNDPTGIGYVFENGQFGLRELKVGGVGDRRN